MALQVLQQPTTGSDGASVIQAGSQAIASGAGFVTVSFVSLFDSVPTVRISIATTVGEDLIYANVRKGSPSVSGFIADLSAPTPTANYVLYWEAAT